MLTLEPHQVCTCREPETPVDPRRRNACGRCLKLIEPLTNDEVVGEFFNRLGESLFRYDAFGELQTSKAFDAFRDHCMSRENAGREQFVNRFMSRDSIAEALEEFCDGGNYMMMDSLRATLEDGDDRDVDLVLTVAMFAFKAYEGCLQLAEKRSAGTGPGWDTP